MKSIDGRVKSSEYGADIVRMYQNYSMLNTVVGPHYSVACCRPFFYCLLYQ